MVLLVVGCGSEPEPSVPAAGNVFRVELSQQRGGMIAAFVHDDVGVVIDAQRIDPAQNPGGAGDGAIADPDSSSLLVSWIGGVCHFGPTVTLSGAGGRLVVRLRPDADEGHAGPPVGACDDIGMFFGVRLILATPVGQDAIDFRVVRP
jgi:hypothetical protein